MKCTADCCKFTREETQDGPVDVLEARFRPELAERIEKRANGAPIFETIAELVTLGLKVEPGNQAKPAVELDQRAVEALEGIWEALRCIEIDRRSRA